MVYSTAVLTDTHGLDNIGIIAEALNKVGVKRAWHLGDFAHQTMSQKTYKDGLSGEQLRSLFSQDNEYREAILEGQFTDSQLEELLEPAQEAKELSEKVSRVQLEEIRRLMSARGVSFDAVVGGNHDLRKPLEDVFEGEYLNGTIKSVEGINVLGLSGGGSHANGCLGDLLCDNPQTFDQRIQTWAKGIMESDAHVAISHVSPTDSVINREEKSSKKQKQLWMERAVSGKEMPVIFSGHLHSETKVEYSEELETFWVQPGVGSLSHNRGTHASFVVSNFDEDTKKLLSVDEFRVYNSARGLQKVELYGTHTLDHENKSVSFEQKNNLLIDKSDPIEFNDGLTLDKNYSLKEKGFNLNYEGLTFEEKDFQFKRNQTIVDSFDPRAKTDKNEMDKRVDIVVEDMKKQYSLKTKGDIENKKEFMGEVLTKLAKELGKNFSINLDDVKEEEKWLFRNIILHASTGLTPGLPSQILSHELENMGDAEKDFANFGSLLSAYINDSLNKTYQSALDSSLTAEDYLGMSEIHMPLGAKRVREHVLEDEARNLYKKVSQPDFMGQERKTGLITKKELEKTKLYEVDSSKFANKRTKEELFDFLGVKEEQPLSVGNIRDMVQSNQAEQLQDKISNMPILTDKDGREYVPGLGEKESELFDNLRDKLDLSRAKTLDEATADGDIKLIKKDGKDYMHVPELGGFVPYSPEDHDFDHSNVVDPELEALQNAISNGLPIISGNDGEDYVISPQGIGKLPDEVKERLDYQSTSLGDVVENGGLVPVNIGGKDMLMLPEGGAIPYSPETFGLDTTQVKYANFEQKEEPSLILNPGQNTPSINPRIDPGQIDPVDGMGYDSSSGLYLPGSIGKIIK